MDSHHYDNWSVYSHAIQEQATRYSSNLGYSGQQMDQYQDGNITHQQLHLMTSNDTEDRLTQAAIQISSVSPAESSTSIQLESSQPQDQEQQAPEDVHDSSSDDQFIESDYINDESANESEVCDEQVHTVTQVEVQMTDVKDSRQSPDDVTQAAQEDSDSISSESESEDAQEYSTRPESSETLGAVSLVTVTAPSASDPQAVDEAAKNTPAEYPAGPEPSLEGSSIVHNRHQASELIKALEHQGTLADLLEELGYQKPRQPERTLLKTHSIASAASDNSQVVCDEPNCGKSFPRPCELK